MPQINKDNKRERMYLETQIYTYFVASVKITDCLHHTLRLQGYKDMVLPQVYKLVGEIT